MISRARGSDVRSIARSASAVTSSWFLRIIVKLGAPIIVYSIALR
jgi:hypothetical protein